MPQISASVRQQIIDAIAGMIEANHKEVKKVVSGASKASFSQMVDALLFSHPAIKPFLKPQSKPKK